ncbi:MULTISPECIES: hypothetical protein [Methylobacterium]|jgi:hypothetical protein|uniref:hypothetical protein n=1 Tax=Methylobacterium TaxID=407 RepID=UPI0011C6FFFB|nr:MULTISPECIES: hypothetical protein [Methylobacterium]TXN43172.1 hypothetical protein FV233_19635 [Methylobacterium sp. WL7]TXN63077.1 hypothetical protein FV228_18470 [Methylobacterium sp. WL18]GJE25004.1 hypothetical protein JHFBIEKO_5483 [Methylobacterium mesophilicum]
MRPRSLAAVVERARGDGDWEHHLRDFLDAFYAADGDVARQSAFVADEPGLLGRPEADAFLGGAGEHLARRWGLPIPGWVRAEERYLTTALFVPGDKALRGYLICVSPVSFRTRLIFTGPDPLQRARFPYHRGVITMPAEHGFPKG